MDPVRSNSAPRSVSIPVSSSPPSTQPTIDDIEAIIQQATSGRPTPDGWLAPVRDTRTQLFVGNLPYRVRWQDLKDLFRKAGIVLRADVSLGPDNRSRGFGTVLLASADDATRAVEMFNGYSWQSRTLEVRPDRSPPDFDNTPNASGIPPSLPSNPPAFVASVPVPVPQHDGYALSFSGTSKNADQSAQFAHGHELGPSSTAGSRTLFVGNLPFHCQWQDLKDLFRQAGTVLRADVALSQDGRSRGFGTVVYATEADAERAVKLFYNYEYNGRVLKVHYDKYPQASLAHIGLTSPTSAAFHTNSMLASNNANLMNAIMTPSTNSHLHLNLPPGYHLDLGLMSPHSPINSYQPSLAQQHRLAQMPTLQQASVRRMQMSGSYDMDDLSTNLAATTFYPHIEDLITKSHSTTKNTNASVNANLNNSADSALPPTTVAPQEKKGQTLPQMHLHRQQRRQVPPAPLPSNHTTQQTQLPPLPSSQQRQNRSELPPKRSQEQSRSPSRLRPSQLQTDVSDSKSKTESSQGSSLQQHPRHPGPISLPPPPTVTSFAQFQLGHGMPVSPLHHPYGMSPLHYPGQSHMVTMTPHGLPPITPSMPPFTFLAPLSPLSMLADSDPRHQYQQAGNPNHVYMRQHPLASPPLPMHSGNMLPAHIGQPVAHHFRHQPNVSAFTPGVAMSPGAFWAGPTGSNPLVNPVVGAPVRSVAQEPREYFDPNYFPAKTTTVTTITTTTTVNPWGGTSTVQSVKQAKLPQPQNQKYAEENESRNDHRPQHTNLGSRSDAGGESERVDSGENDRPTNDQPNGN